MSEEFINKFKECVETYYQQRSEDKHSRYRSWEYCNQFFNEKHTELMEKRKNGCDLCEKDYDHLALHLSFYLASWGMYRPTSPLLYTDYKIHIPVVKELMREDYDNLWNITYKELDLEKNKIVNLTDKIMNELYGERTDDVEKFYDKKMRITETLATKILLGTLACVPAYDSNFIKAIRKYKNGIADPTKPKSLKALAEFYKDNEEELNDLIKKFEKDGVVYPQMKLLDMGFYQYGRELKEEKNKHSSD